MYKNKFKLFNGVYIPEIIEYLKVLINNDPYLTITVGCDSIQSKRKTVYAVTITIYNFDYRKGAHVVFFREYLDKVKDNQERLFNEANYVYNVGMFLDKNLSSFYNRLDLNNYQLKKYKFHLLNCNGNFLNIPNNKIDEFIKNLTLLESEHNYRLVDLHVDFNPVKGDTNEKNVLKNKSYVAYKNYVPWLRGVGFRTWVKPMAFAATSAADLLLRK